MEPREAFDKTRQLLKAHHEWMKGTVNLIASENIPSPAVREALATDFGNRYAEGQPGERVYAGCKMIDEVEFLTIDLAKKLFRAEHANVQPISGAVANIAMYTALTEPGDRMLCLPIPSGGHITMGKKSLGGGAGAVHGLEVDYFPFDDKIMNIDVEGAIKKIEDFKPKLVMFGASMFLFPHPVKELAPVAHENGAIVVYDPAHVLGLIGCGQFQDPLREGADVMTGSTHKTLPGPQHGIITCKKEFADAINKGVFPGMVSNHHLHALAGVAIALAEMLEFGKEYMAQVVKNAQALGREMQDRGFNMLCPDQGFTKSHTVVAEITKHGDGGELEKTAEAANIILNRNLLPWDIREGRNYKHPGGLRLGTSECTRLGMKEDEMAQIAEFLKRIIIDKEKPEKVAPEVRKFAEQYQKVHYAFESATEAYEYIEIL